MTVQTVQAYICGMAGAIYCATDMIIMEKFKEKGADKYYLKVTVTIDDVVEKTATYEMTKLPTYLQEIYDYVNETSIIEYSFQNGMYTLYGDHIGRARDYKFALGKFTVNPLAQGVVHTLPLEENGDALDEILVDISDKMIATKSITICR